MCWLCAAVIATIASLNRDWCSVVDGGNTLSVCWFSSCVCRIINRNYDAMLCALCVHKLKYRINFNTFFFSLCFGPPLPASSMISSQSLKSYYKPNCRIKFRARTLFLSDSANLFIHWSCNSRVNVISKTVKIAKHALLMFTLAMIWATENSKFFEYTAPWWFYWKTHSIINACQPFGTVQRSFSYLKC